MSPKTSHIRRRRHAAPSPTTNWVRRAGVAGGVIGTLALSGMSAPANANQASTPESPDTAQTAEQAPALSTSASAVQAVEALDQTVVDLKLQAAYDSSVTAALRTAEEAKQAEDQKAAEEKAAQERQAAEQAASRSAQRTALSASSADSSSSSAPSVSSAVGGIASVISFLKDQVGKPYVYGATGPDSYDCSGLTEAAFRTIGVDLPRTSQAQSNVGTPVSLDSLQIGDLVFWGGQGSAYHVAVYIGGGDYLDAANPSKGVVIQKMSYYMPDFATRVV